LQENPALAPFIILIRGVFSALDQVNKTGNYTVFRDLAASEFRINDGARLAEFFKQKRADKLILEAY